MDDDIRDRFRGVRRGDYGAPLRPRPAAPAPRPASPPPVPKPVPAPKPAASAPAWAIDDDDEPLIKPPKPAKEKKQRKKRGKGKRGRKFLLFLIILALLAAGGYVAYKKFLQKKPASVASDTSNQTATQTNAPQRTGTIHFIATGDNLAFDSINNYAKQPDGSYNYLPMMSLMKPLFANADIRLCNETTPAGGAGLGVSGYPNFNSPTEWTTGFVGVGCNVVNLATDHVNDKGQPGIDATVASWENQKDVLAVAGANRSADEQNKIRYFSVKGVKFAFLAYTTKSNNKSVSAFGLNTYSDDLATKQITEARKTANIIIVSMTWGNENSSDITPDQDAVAQKLADQNVDVVVGVGSRVIQPAKILSGKNGHQSLVWFGLGNFLNSELPIENLIGGMAVMDIDAASLHITNPKLLPLYMHYEWTAAQKAAGTVNARHGFSLYPLDAASDALANSQDNTTVQAQTDRVTSIITKFAPIKVMKSTDPF